MRLALAVQVDERWAYEHEVKPRPNHAAEAIRAEVGDDLLDPDTPLGRVEVVDGSQGRGAEAWIPVIEWLADEAGGGIVAYATVAGVREGIKRLRGRIQTARPRGHRTWVSRGLAVAIAMDHVFETTDEADVLDVEVAQEPSLLGGGEPTERSYTGLEPWIVLLLNRTRTTRYVLGVSAEGDVHGCVAMPIDEDEARSLVPPTDDRSS